MLSNLEDRLGSVTVNPNVIYSFYTCSGLKKTILAGISLIFVILIVSFFQDFFL